MLIFNGHMARFFRFALLFPAVALFAAASDPGVTHTELVTIPELPKSGYLESYVDPVFGSRVTRITGDAGCAIPGIDARWDEVARHGYSKDSAWNCDQSMLVLKRHHGSPSLLFLDGESDTSRVGNGVNSAVRGIPFAPPTEDRARAGR